MCTGLICSAITTFGVPAGRKYPGVALLSITNIIMAVSDKEILQIRNKLFLERGVPILAEQRFIKSPFKADWYGRNNLGDFSYVHYRLAHGSNLEMVDTQISRGDKWEKIYLNIFQLHPHPASLHDLEGNSGTQFHLPPNSQSRMRLRIDDFKGMPLFNFTSHKLKPFFGPKGLQRRALQLGALIAKDLTNLDYYINRWHQLHIPQITDWGGNPVEQGF